MTLPPASARRPIPPDIVCGAGEGPADLTEGAAFLVDKPSGPTSFDVVRVVRARAGVRKVGHAGTLDPMASGLLIVLVARPATRLQDAFMHLPKTYTGRIRFGEATRSHDCETEVVRRAPRSDLAALTLDALRSAREAFLGPITQVPPMYSAIKVDGERLYEKARRGETVDRPPRQVRIDAFELFDFDGRDASFRVDCSKGTYIRSLARDLGDALGVGAHLVALRRESIGPFAVADAWTLDALRDALDAWPPGPERAAALQ